MAFRVGQKVVCIKESSLHRTLCPVNNPVVGQVYTIRRIATYPGYGTGIWLNEIVNQPTPTAFGILEKGFYIERFRPVVERKTDISIFEKMLTGGKQPARVS